jgi:hypothetical protein
MFARHFSSAGRPTGAIGQISTRLLYQRPGHMAHARDMIPGISENGRPSQAGVAAAERCLQHAKRRWRTSAGSRNLGMAGSMGFYEAIKAHLEPVESNIKTKFRQTIAIHRWRGEP